MDCPSDTQRNGHHYGSKGTKFYDIPPGNGALVLTVSVDDLVSLEVNGIQVKIALREIRSRKSAKLLFIAPKEVRINSRQREEG